ncbi:MAG: hypothetical protein F6K31_30215 [Symploca sp. SIO2G7]|nr:hypothetical protein [Symploca sp. SIO2G7]
MATKKKVSFGTKPKANVDDWVDNREVPEEPPVAETPAPVEPEPEVEEPQKEKMKRLTLDIPESLHRRIKGKAVMEGVTMVEMLRELMEETYG